MAQINAVENPIINSPYEEPQQALAHRDRQATRDARGPAAGQLLPARAGAGGPRAARSENRTDLFEEDAKGEEYLLDLANLLRQRVQEWRERDYSGATTTTRELIELWRAADRAQPLFYAQLEAAETVIFLVEGPADLRQGVQVPMDEPGPAAKEAGYRAFQRYALKMATGSGKTTVMGMLAAWSILNKVSNPQAPEYSDTVLILCPNITIRDRLRELNPNLDELSLYRTRDLVPAHRMTDLRRGEVFITNWHNLERRELGDVNGQGARVVKRGVAVENTRVIRLTAKVTEEEVRQQATLGVFDIVAEDRNRYGAVRAFTVRETKYYESDAAFLKRILGGRKGRSSAILVMNDEAHHAYRRGIEEEDEYALDEETAKANAREATVWIEGLDRINKALGGRGNGIRLCVDLSATPFYIQGSGNEVGQPFPWVVSDFSLLEAIEAGLVKIPQLPTDDSSGEETPAFFNVWRWVEKRAQQDGHIGPIGAAEVMKYATAPIILLAAEWRRTLAVWKEHFQQGNRKDDVPPVFIIVCRDTTIARAMYEWLAEGDAQYGTGVPEFRNARGAEVTVRIDSKVGEEIAAGSGQDESRRLRFVLETIGRTAWPGGRVPDEYAALVEKHNRKVLEDDDSDGVTINPETPPGRDVRCIISVSMLSEGWDATTVTHVVGLRPFGSQLLCEQVVGRALRRTSYAVNPETGLFTEETAQIFGVPFELIPFKVEGGKPQPPTPPANHVYAETGEGGVRDRVSGGGGLPGPGHRQGCGGLGQGRRAGARSEGRSGRDPAACLGCRGRELGRLRPRRPRTSESRRVAQGGAVAAGRIRPREGADHQVEGRSRRQHPDPPAVSPDARRGDPVHRHAGRMRRYAAEAGHGYQPLLRAGGSHAGQRDGRSRRRRCEPGAPHHRPRRVRHPLHCDGELSHRQGHRRGAREQVPPECRGVRLELGASGGGDSR